MNYYLLDAENISVSQLISHIEMIKKDSVLVIFSKRHISVSEERLKKLKKCFSQVYTEDVPIQVKNGVDFGIVVGMTILAAQTRDSSSFYIISNDKGFDAALFECRKYLNQHKFERLQTNNDDIASLFTQKERVRTEFQKKQQSLSKGEKRKLKQAMATDMENKMKIKNSIVVVNDILLKSRKETFVKKMSNKGLCRNECAQVINTMSSML